MARLYELTKEYDALLDAVETTPGEVIDKTTGEVMTEDEFLARLYALEGEIDGKVEACAKVVRTLEADAGAIRFEEVQLAERRRRLEKRVDDLRGYMTAEMLKAQRPKVKTALFTIYLGAEGDEVVVQDIAAVPDAFIKPPPPREALLDRAALRKALKEAAVPGAVIQKNGKFPLTIRVGK